MKQNNQGLVCPVCHNKVTETAKFCSECGVGLTLEASDAAWIVAMQEKIKKAKESNLYLTIFGVVGALTAIAIPFITRFALRHHMDTISWVLTGAGILFFIGGFIGTWYNDNIVKKLIEQLGKGNKLEGHS